MIINFARNPYSTSSSIGVQRNFQIQTGPLRVQGSNDRRLDETGYHHSNQVTAQTLGSEWSTLLGAATDRSYQPQPALDLSWTRQWMA